MDTSFRKQLVVLLGTLAILLLLLLPNVRATFANRYGMTMGVIPLAILLSFAASHKPWQTSSFICGVAMIMLGIGFFTLMGQLPVIAKLAEQAGRISKDTVKDWTEGVDLWIYSLPVVSMAIGVNLISSYISSEPPTSDSNSPTS